jgi:diadenosine tetraphosphatase ApaH/serine/threonine PP2A family protein phosphatase
VEGFHIVHGSPVDEDEYLVDAAEASTAFQYVTTPLVFFGHTHLQGGFVWRRDGVRLVPNPAWQDGCGPLEFELDAAYLINPGSVGQPRDNDPRAAFALYNSEEGFMTYCRLPYDVAKAQEKIRHAGLPPVLADRLAVGR